MGREAWLTKVVVITGEVEIFRPMPVLGDFRKTFIPNHDVLRGTLRSPSSFFMRSNVSFALPNEVSIERAEVFMAPLRLRLTRETSFRPVDRLLAFGSGIRARAKVSSGGTRAAEETREDGLEERAEDDLRSVGHWERHPEDKDELEDVVEGLQSVSQHLGVKFWEKLTEPVNGINQALNNGEKGIYNPVLFSN